ncbi:MAG: YhcH/YjgK/YiaL family protein [Clostridia bacterium]|nr:YhcH/YjgK/YiaL family protein [Clostridia bacterium]
MIFDQIQNLSVYRAVLPGMEAVLDFLSRTELTSLAAGKIRLGGGVVCNVNRYEPKTESKWEAHRNYIDLQYVVSGAETMVYASLDDAVDADEYNAEKDLHLFGNADRSVSMAFHAGDFALFFPQDVHMPGLKNEETDGEVLKLVFKIPTPSYEYIAHLQQLCEAIALPADAAAAVLSAAEKIPAEKANTLTAAFFANEDVQPQIEALAEEIGISVPLCDLTVYMMFARQTYYNYLSHGVSQDIYEDSMTDFTVWNLTCVRNTDAPGLLQMGWLEMTLKEKLYRIGRFQYEPTTFRHGRFACGDYVVRQGDPVLTIHIPEGEPLTDEVRLDSYRRAEKFFGSHIFVCHSWLLYPAHRAFLQNGSRIVSFMDDFVMLSSEEKRGDIGNLWRMYGFKCDHRDFASLPETTGMQRAYKKHLLETGGMTGEGYGIFIIEDGKLITKA